MRRPLRFCTLFIMRAARSRALPTRARRRAPDFWKVSGVAASDAASEKSEGSASGRTPQSFLDAAADLGRALAAAGVVCVHGGGKQGCMGALHRATKAAGGVVHCVIHETFVDEELALGADELIITRGDDLSERKTAFGKNAFAEKKLKSYLELVCDGLHDALLQLLIGAHHARDCCSALLSVMAVMDQVVHRRMEM